MINTQINSMPVYTTREVRNCGVYKPYQLYKYKFTPEENSLLRMGALKKFPLEMCDFYANRPVMLIDKKYDLNESVDVKLFDEDTLNVLLRTGTIICSLKEEFKSIDEAKLSNVLKIYSLIGMNYKNASEFLGIEFDVIKEKFDLKQGGANKKIKEKDLDKFKEILGV